MRGNTSLDPGRLLSPISKVIAVWELTRERNSIKPGVRKPIPGVTLPHVGQFLFDPELDAFYALGISYLKQLKDRRLIKMSNDKTDVIGTQAQPHPLTSHCMLASLRISVWSGRKDDKRVRGAAADRYGADHKAVTGSKLLVPQESLQGVSAAVTALRDTYIGMTLPWLDEGARVLPAKKFWDFQKDIQAKIEAFEVAKDQFVKRYLDLKADAPNKLGSLYDEANYPDEKELDGKFGVELSFLPFPSSQDFRVEGLGAAGDLIKANLNSIPSQMGDIARDDIGRRVKEVARKMVERLKAYSGGKEGAFRDSLVENVRELVEILPNLNITGDEDVADLIQKLEAIGRVEAEDLRKDKGLREETARQAEVVVKIVDKMRDFV